MEWHPEVATGIWSCEVMYDTQIIIFFSFAGFVINFVWNYAWTLFWEKKNLISIWYDFKNNVWMQHIIDMYWFEYNCVVMFVYHDEFELLNTLIYHRSMLWSAVREVHGMLLCAYIYWRLACLHQSLCSVTGPEISLAHIYRATGNFRNSAHPSEHPMGAY